MKRIPSQNNSISNYNTSNIIRNSTNSATSLHQTLGNRMSTSSSVNQLGSLRSCYTQAQKNPNGLLLVNHVSQQSTIVSPAVAQQADCVFGPRLANNFFVSSKAYVAKPRSISELHPASVGVFDKKLNITSTNAKDDSGKNIVNFQNMASNLNRKIYPFANLNMTHVISAEDLNNIPSECAEKLKKLPGTRLVNVEKIITIMKTLFNKKTNVLNRAVDKVSLGIFGFGDYSVLILVIILSLRLGILMLLALNTKVKSYKSNLYLFSIILLGGCFLRLQRNCKDLVGFKLTKKGNEIAIVYLIFLIVLYNCSGNASHSVLRRSLQDLYKSLKQVNGLYKEAPQHRLAVDYLKKEMRHIKSHLGAKPDHEVYNIFGHEILRNSKNMNEVYKTNLKAMYDYAARKKEVVGFISPPKKLKKLCAEKFHLKLLNQLKKSFTFKQLKLIKNYHNSDASYMATEMLCFLPSLEVMEMFYYNHFTWHMEHQIETTFHLCNKKIVTLILLEIYLFNGIKAYPLVDHYYPEKAYGGHFYRCVFHLNKSLLDNEDVQSSSAFFTESHTAIFRRRGKKPRYGVEDLYFRRGNYYFLHVMYMSLFIEKQYMLNSQNDKIKLYFEMYIDHLRNLLIYFKLDKNKIHTIFYKNITGTWKNDYERFIKTYLKEYNE